ncbi:MAG TPA: PAS domain S-box protein [Thermoanaerobaculia bacterium]|nr:PAS domain S-box protein [Thermoanaerobaculia bacterium]
MSESEPRQHHIDPPGREELALLMDAVQDYAIFLLGPDGEIRSWNTGAQRVMGYPADEVLGRNFSLFYGPEDLENRKPQHELEVATSEGRIEDEGWRVRKDGTRFWANTVITLLPSKDGKPRGFAKITRDLTQRREAEERLRQSEEQFRLLVEAVKDYAIFMLDPNGYIRTWNAGAHRVKQYTSQEIIGKHFSIFYPEQDKREGKPQRELDIALAWGSVEDEGWRLRKDGSMFWANVVITAIFDETGALRGFTKVTRDITERKRAEEAQRALLEQREALYQAEEERRRAEASYRVAQEANRAKDEFLMTLSHELRTPMTAILGWSRLLPTLPPTDPAFKDGIRAIGRSAQLQARLIDDVLDVSRIVSGKLRLTVENIEIVRLIAMSVEAVRPSAQAKNITIRTELAQELGTITGDPTRLQQILWNLLTNAVKFTPKEGLIEVKARRTSSHLQISVQDTGEGIENAFLPHIFEPFRQAESATTRTHGGLGLGLSIVRYIAEAHGGTIAAESAGRGRGSTFTLTLPIGAMKVQPQEPRVDATLGPIHTVPLGRLNGMTILLVDDDPEGRQLVRTVLQQAGATVTAVDSAAHALADLAEKRPDLVITDIAMPEMDGYTFAREMRKKNELTGMKVIALSAFPAGKVAAEEGGFDDYLAKPIEPSELVDAVARVGGRPN